MTKYLAMLTLLLGASGPLGAQIVTPLTMDGQKPHSPRFPAISADGSTVAFGAYDANQGSGAPEAVMIVRSDGTGMRKIAHLPSPYIVGWTRISADGSTVAFLQRLYAFADLTVYDADVMVVDVPTGTVTNLTPNTPWEVIEGLDITADGSKLVFARWSDDPKRVGVFVINADGTGETRIFDKPGDTSISGDGSTVAASVWVGNQVVPHLMKADGTGVLQVQTPEVYDLSPLLDHVGQRVVFEAINVVAGGRIYSANQDGTWIYQSPVGFLFPSISGDGEWVSYGYKTSLFAPETYLGRSRIDGTEHEHVWEDGSHFQLRSISFDGSRIALRSSLAGTLMIADWNLPNLKLTGPAALGNPIQFHVNGTAGDEAILFLSQKSASLPAPPYGTFGVDPTAMVVVAAGGMPSGTTHVDLTIPQDPALLGIHVYVQAAVGAPPLATGAKLTNVLDIAIE